MTIFVTQSLLQSLGNRQQDCSVFKVLPLVTQNQLTLCGHGSKGFRGIIGCRWAELEPFAVHICQETNATINALPQMAEQRRVLFIVLCWTSWATTIKYLHTTKKKLRQHRLVVFFSQKKYPIHHMKTASVGFLLFVACKRCKCCKPLLEGLQKLKHDGGD